MYRRTNRLMTNGLMMHYLLAFIYLTFYCPKTMCTKGGLKKGYKSIIRQVQSVGRRLLMSHQHYSKWRRVRHTPPTLLEPRGCVTHFYIVKNLYLEINLYLFFNNRYLYLLFTIHTYLLQFWSRGTSYRRLRFDQSKKRKKVKVVLVFFFNKCFLI